MSINIDDFKPYDPPLNPGLENSPLIIPEYYELHKHPSKILDVDYLKIINDSIRNFRKLNKYQLEYIKELSSEEKYKLIELYNECFGTLEEIL